MFLTPNLPPLQHARLQDALSRLSGLFNAPLIYTDADRLAGAYMLAPHHDHPRATDTADELARTHHVPLVLAGWIAGLAFGVRLGRTFGLRGAARPRRYISDLYARLSEEDRREVGKLIRRLSKGESVCMVLEPRHKPTPAKAELDDVTIARQWMRQMGVAARAKR